MSALWQAWCVYCRDIVIGSAAGAITTSGNLTSSIYCGRTTEEIAYVAARYASSKAVTTIQPISAMRKEPTWGDVTKLNLIINGINPTNRANLFSGIAGISLIKDLQLFRNASAHVNIETIADVKNSRVRYDETNFRHPSDTMFWVDPKTKDYLWKSWLEEIDLVSDFISK
jgi:hypothetical protein